MLERIDHMRALAPETPRSRLALNLRAGESFTLLPEGATVPITVRVVCRHGQGARLEVVAERSVRISHPNGNPA